MLLTTNNKPGLTKKFNGTFHNPSSKPHLCELSN
jgi:hypothetical protein